MQRPHRDGFPRGLRATDRFVGLFAQRSRRPATRLGAECTRPLAHRPRLRSRADGPRVLARGVNESTLLPLRWAQPGGARATRAQPSAAIPGDQDRRRVLAAPPAADRRRAGRRRRRDQRCQPRRRVGGDRRPQAGEVDGEAPPGPRRARADRGRRRLRLPRRTGSPGSALAAACWPRMGLPPCTRTAPAVASVPAVQPALCERIRASARRAPPQRREVLEPPPVRLPGRDLKELLGDAVPRDHARQTLADRYIEQEIGRRDGQPWRVLDLGCGVGSSLDVFRARDPHVDWVGIDVPDSPEARLRTRTDARFETFDGVSIPFAESTFDLVYCKQVLEHVRHPEPLLAEVRRVLVAGGWFAGSTSQLETYHSRSLWNYTPAGMAALLEQAGLRAVEFRPGIDGFTLIGWRVAGGHRYFHRWWGRESPFNQVLNGCGRIARADIRALNAAKLLFCGQFAFLAQRDPSST